MSLTLHQHPFASYCWKALIALDELGLPFESVQIDTPDDWAAFAELWEMSKMPVIVDDEAGVVLPEATIVVEYVDRLAGGGRMIPDDPDVALDVRLWDRLFDGFVMTPMQKIVLDNLRPEDQRDAFGVDEARGILDNAYAMLDRRLPSEGFAAGPDFTLADCSAAPSLHYARAVQRWDEDGLVNLTAYHRRLEQRPSVARVIEAARPYREFFPPGWPADIG
ncbi:MAG: glutathione S-transferase family protein [Solirubrobacterales bacterium]